MAKGRCYYYMHNLEELENFIKWKILYYSRKLICIYFLYFYLPHVLCLVEAKFCKVWPISYNMKIYFIIILTILVLFFMLIFFYLVSQIYKTLFWLNSERMVIDSGAISSTSHNAWESSKSWNFKISEVVTFLREWSRDISLTTYIVSMIEYTKMKSLFYFRQVNTPTKTSAVVQSSKPWKLKIDNLSHYQRERPTR
jgi:hypothetical protein